MLTGFILQLKRALARKQTKHALELFNGRGLIFFIHLFLLTLINETYRCTVVLSNPYFCDFIFRDVIEQNKL